MMGKGGGGGLHLSREEGSSMTSNPPCSSTHEGWVPSEGEWPDTTMWRLVIVLEEVPSTLPSTCPHVY